MGKKRTKTRAAEKEGLATKAKRDSELRALFDAAGNHTQTEVSNQTFNARLSQTQTPTPTPTVPTEVTDANASRMTSSLAYERPEATKTRAPLRTVIAENPYKPARRLDAPPRGKDENDETAWWLGPALISGALAMFAVGWLHIQRSNVVAHPVGHPTSTLESMKRETADKISFYRNQLGHRLNRDRVNVEILNQRAAPPLDATASPQLDRSMMRGVPLMQENYVDQNYSGSRNNVENLNIDHPDARIQYGLQEEQHRDEFDRRVQAQYTREFIENARREGIDVTVDLDGNVIRVAPLGSSQNSSRTPGGGFSSGPVR